MVLQQLQDLLTGIYDLPLDYRVYDFLFTQREKLPPAIRATATDEQVLVRQDEDGASVGVYLDPALLQRLAVADPLQSLHIGNIADYCTALEGVSHFICLAWHGTHDRAVSLLELELQAEIDKYVVSWWLLRAQDPERMPAELHHVLFQHARIDAALAGDRYELYRQAHQYAALFCACLQRRLSRRAQAAHSAALTELRRFYRLSRERKLRHIRHLG